MDTKKPLTGMGEGRSWQKGTTFFEIMVAIAILLMALIGGSSMHAMGRSQLITQQRCQAAIHLASSQLEGLRAMGYDGLDVGEQQNEIATGGQTYLCRTYTQLTAEPTAQDPRPCKQITVFVGWSRGEQQHLFSLATYVGP